jgi:hypothetical protein
MNALKDKKNGEALDVLADLLEPIQSITTNEEIGKLREKEDYTYIEFVKALAKHCQNEVITILATIDGIKVEEADYSAMQILGKLMELFADEDFRGFFI